MEQIYEIEPLLKAGVCIQIHPQGYSMYPFIDPRRDEVVLAGIEDGSALRRGDVVLYRRENGMLVLHRIYKIGYGSDRRAELLWCLPRGCGAW